MTTNDSVLYCTVFRTVAYNTVNVTGLVQLNFKNTDALTGNVRAWNVMPVGIEVYRVT